MKDAINTVIEGGWPVLGYALIVFAILLALFGFLPGVLNRLFAMAYPKDDPRRAEMIAELYGVPRWEQPWWVFQQGERALFEGLPVTLRAQARVRRQAPIEWSWTLDGSGRFTVAMYWYKRRAGSTPDQIRDIARSHLEKHLSRAGVSLGGDMLVRVGASPITGEWVATLEARRREHDAPLHLTYSVDWGSNGSTKTGRSRSGRRQAFRTWVRRTLQNEFY